MEFPDWVQVKEKNTINWANVFLVVNLGHICDMVCTEQLQFGLCKIAFNSRDK